MRLQMHPWFKKSSTELAQVTSNVLFWAVCRRANMVGLEMVPANESTSVPTVLGGMSPQVGKGGDVYVGPLLGISSLFNDNGTLCRRGGRGWWGQIPPFWTIVVRNGWQLVKRFRLVVRHCAAEHSIS